MVMVKPVCRHRYVATRRCRHEGEIGSAASRHSAVKTWSQPLSAASGSLSGVHRVRFCTWQCSPCFFIMCYIWYGGPFIDRFSMKSTWHKPSSYWGFPDRPPYVAAYSCPGYPLQLCGFSLRHGSAGPCTGRLGGWWTDGPMDRWTEKGGDCRIYWST